ncbi:MAG: hypothetical protein V4501_05745 [Pseudomonadota bacterium]
MENKRIISYCLSQKLNVQDLEKVSAAGETFTTCGGVGYGNGGPEIHVDATYDF